MSKFLITGGKQLNGEIGVAGSKNAVLAVMAACLLTNEQCVLKNVPDIKDVETMIEILRSLGVRVNKDGATLTIMAAQISNYILPKDLVTKFRGSILLVGALLGRLGKVELPSPGGDKIGNRPIDTHIAALSQLGVTCIQTNELKFSAGKLVGNRVVLEETSVTATENIMMAAARAEGKTTIRLAAMEPHVQQLGRFLQSMGVKISGFGTPTIVIEGVEKLNGAQIEIIPDSEEAASLITMAAANKGNVKITGLIPDYLEDYFVKLRKMKVNFTIGADFVQVLPPKGDYVGTKIQAGLYPKLNSDYVPPMAVLAAVSKGETLIYEWLYENRLGHIAELKKMGAQAEILDPHRVKIIGPTKLTGSKITTYDLRMGMTLVIAALVARGQSEISDIHHIDRGYERLEERLQALGANIKRID